MKRRTAINSVENPDRTHGPQIGAAAAWQQIDPCAASLLILSIAAAQAQAFSAPQISGLCDAALARSGRLQIFGGEFGTDPSTDQVLIDGLAANVTTWTDTEKHDYVPEGASIGSVSVQVVNAVGAGDTDTLDVTLSQPDGRIRRRFQVDSRISGEFITTSPRPCHLARELGMTPSFHRKERNNDESRSATGYIWGTVVCRLGLATREGLAQADLSGYGTPNGLDTHPFGAALMPQTKGNDSNSQVKASHRPEDQSHVHDGI